MFSKKIFIPIILFLLFILFSAKGFKKDEEFFAFYRSMEAYKKAFEESEDEPTFILSPDSDFFKYFNNKSGK